ncbi:MAG: histidine kinase [Chryseolinea sp.]
MARLTSIPVLILLCISFGNVFGQKEQKSTYSKFKSRSKTENVKELLREADAIKNTQPSQALTKVEEALASAIAAGNSADEGKAYLLLGDINVGIAEWTLALQNYTRAYQILAPSYKGSTDFTTALQGLGLCYSKTGEYELSLKYYAYLSQRKLAGEDTLDVKLHVAEVYYEMGKYNEALDQINDIQSTKQIISPGLSTRIQNQLAKIYARKSEFEKTQNSYSNSLEIARDIKSGAPKSDKAVQETKEEISEVLRDQKKYDDEIRLRNSSIEYNLGKSNLAEVSKDKVKIGESLEAKGDTDGALRSLLEASSIADTLNNPQAKANSYLPLAEFYYRSGKMKESASTYKKFSVAISEVNVIKQSKQDVRENLIKQQKGIESLANDVSIGRREETIDSGTIARQRIIIYGLILIVVIIAITSFFIYRNARASKIANQLLALKSLRSQMNPHFIFNALNSINQFIANQDERTANRFLSEFSRLMRLVLETSQEDFISLSKEIEILSLYLKLEQYRFRDKFDYIIDIDPSLNPDFIEVPPMLIQPYIENAVWHGLRYKESKGTLSLKITQVTNNLLVEIIDNGIGRDQSKQFKTAHQKRQNSTGLKNIEDRLTIINEVYHTAFDVNVSDGVGGGTHVTLTIPINHKSHAA